MGDDSEKADTLAGALELIADGDWLTCSGAAVLHRAAECLRVQKAEVERLRATAEDLRLALQVHSGKRLSPLSDAEKRTVVRGLAFCEVA